MKRTVLFIAAVMSFAFGKNLDAQTDISLVGGLYNSGTKATMVSDGFVDINPITSLSGGVIVQHKLDKLLSVRSGLLYQKRGFQVSEGTSFNVLGMNIPIGVKAVNEIHYMEVPAMIQLDIPSGNNLSTYIAAGPSFGYATSGSIDTRASSIIDFNIASVPLDLSSNNFNRMDISANILGGLKIPYGNSHFLVEAGYSQALNDFVSDDFIIDAGGKHYGWSLNVGYGIRF